MGRLINEMIKIYINMLYLNDYIREWQRPRKSTTCNWLVTVSYIRGKIIFTWESRFWKTNVQMFHLLLLLLPSTPPCECTTRHPPPPTHCRGAARSAPPRLPNVTNATRAVSYACIRHAHIPARQVQTRRNCTIREISHLSRRVCAFLVIRKAKYVSKEGKSFHQVTKRLIAFNNKMCFRVRVI